VDRVGLINRSGNDSRPFQNDIRHRTRRIDGVQHHPARRPCGLDPDVPHIVDAVRKRLKNAHVLHSGQHQVSGGTRQYAALRTDPVRCQNRYSAPNPEPDRQRPQNRRGKDRRDPDDLNDAKGKRAPCCKNDRVDENSARANELDSGADLYIFHAVMLAQYRRSCRRPYSPPKAHRHPNHRAQRISE
jgi:hypothetical protein